MMKKIVCILLIACSLLVLNACGSNDLPDGMKKVTNESVDYTLYYPETWEVVQNDGTIMVQSPAELGKSSNANVLVTAYTVDSDTTAQSYWNGYTEMLKTTFLNYTLTESTETVLNDVPALSVSYTATIMSEKHCYTQVFAVRYATIYTLTYSASEADFEAHKEDFGEFIEHFDFKD